MEIWLCTKDLTGHEGITYFWAGKEYKRGKQTALSLVDEYACDHILGEWEQHFKKV
jgi:hypothetical protein|tara:strand:+ start:184 stop:351 length:168 start_codon:yes stop_codon:yes gene_type:complete